MDFITTESQNQYTIIVIFFQFSVESSKREVLDDRVVVLSTSKVILRELLNGFNQIAG